VTNFNGGDIIISSYILNEEVSNARNISAGITGSAGSTDNRVSRATIQRMEIEKKE
jgi:hypothetical protein